MPSGFKAAKLEIKRVLVIDDDQVARNLIANHLQQLGADDVVLTDDGEAGWQALKSGTFDLIVLDWKLPKLSGLALFNRIRRNAPHRSVPLLVVSGFLEKNDFRLLQEFPATALMEKPFTGVRFQNRVEELVKESVWYAQNVELVDSVMAAVQSDGKRAEALLKQVIKTAPNPVPLAVLAARRLIKGGLVKTAQSILEGILKIDEQCVAAMNELGKVLHLQGEHKLAVEALRLANKLSPQNLERLCLLGEVGLNLRDPESARAYFEKALLIDPEDRRARSGVVIAENMQDMIATDPLQVPRSFASLMNTMGIALVRTGQFARGIDQYRSALAFLSEKEDAARIAFNLGLGYLRWGKPADALPWFQQSEKIAPSGFGKSAAYVRTLLTGNGGAEIEDKPQLREASMTVAPLSTPDAGSDGGGQVIPFPVPAAKSETDDDAFMPTERHESDDDEATQVVLKDVEDGRGVLADPGDEADQGDAFAKMIL